MQEVELQEISGSVEDIVYRNQDTGFAVIHLGVEDELVCVVGTLATVEIGEELHVMGRFSSHPTYGYQFKAEAFDRQLPATSGAIMRYLASGVVKGIGPTLARRIVERFGDETLEKIEENPSCLAEVKGISPKKAEALAEEFKHVFGVRRVMLFLSKFSISPVSSVKIWKLWGPESVNMITANPYLLCGEDVGLPFEVSDTIAQHFELDMQSEARISAAVRYVLAANLNNGHTCLPLKKLLSAVLPLLEVEKETVLSVIETMAEEQSLVEVERGQPYYYLPDLFVAENYIAARIGEMAGELTNDAANADELIDAEERRTGIEYESLQRRAIRAALCENIMILTGGPGTGKTTTLNGMIDILESQQKTVYLAAPTGRAAKRMSDVTGREAKTIHRLLEAGYNASGKLTFARNDSNRLECDVIVIDEMSMVDTLLFEALLRAAKPECKLILVGDSDQLPSVGAGNVLRDLIDSECITIVTLREIFRQAAQSLIVTNAHDIVQGELPDLSRKDNDFFFLSRENMSQAVNTVLQLVCERLPKSYGYSPVKDIQVLCPSRKGELGVELLNTRLQMLINPESKEKKQVRVGVYTFREGDKVMQVRNNYDLPWVREEEKGVGIYNGDIGTIIAIDTHNGYILVDFEGRIASCTIDQAEDLELAYAVTVHKSQGSEFNAVIIPVLGGFDKLYFRNLLYTAVTRAKQLLILVGSRERVAYMVKNNRKMLRYTGLKYWLQNYVLSDTPTSQDKGK